MLDPSGSITRLSGRDKRSFENEPRGEYQRSGPPVGGRLAGPSRARSPAPVEGSSALQPSGDSVGARHGVGRWFPYQGVDMFLHALLSTIVTEVHAILLNVVNELHAILITI